MARFVLLNEVCSSHWLVWTVRGGASCLRDYRADTPTENRKLTTKQIESLLSTPGNGWEKAPRIAITDVSFWREQQYLRDVESGFAKGGRERLLNVFKRKLRQILGHGDRRMLKTELDRWTRGFIRIVNKPQFNHWDNDDATSYQGLDKGIGWSALMLEGCRAGGRTCFIETGDKQLDFAAMAMEVVFGMSSRKNPFQPGKADFVKPDGLGVRRDGSLCVLELKGPKDDGDLLEATLQGVCGALATFAKREMVYRISRIPGAKRPAMGLKRIPTGRPTLAVYVMVAARNHRGRPMFQWRAELENICSLILQAFPQLREVVYFAVDPDVCPKLESLTPYKLLRVERLSDDKTKQASAG